MQPRPLTLILFRRVAGVWSVRLRHRPARCLSARYGPVVQLVQHHHAAAARAAGAGSGPGSDTAAVRSACHGSSAGSAAAARANADLAAVRRAGARLTLRRVAAAVVALACSNQKSAKPRSLSSPGKKPPRCR